MIRTIQIRHTETGNNGRPGFSVSIETTTESIAFMAPDISAALAAIEAEHAKQERRREYNAALWAKGVA